MRGTMRAQNGSILAGINRFSWDQFQIGTEAGPASAEEKTFHMIGEQGRIFHVRGMSVAHNLEELPVGKAFGEGHGVGFL